MLQSHFQMQAIEPYNRRKIYSVNEDINVDIMALMVNTVV